MRLGSVVCVEEVNRSDLDSHADCCVCGREVLVLNDFDREVTVTGWDPAGETQSLSIVSAAMGYIIPESGQTVILIAHQSIFSPYLNHNLLSTMRMRLHDVIVSETPKFQYLNPTKISHSISVRGDNMEDVLLIPLYLHGMMDSWGNNKVSGDCHPKRRQVRSLRQKEAEIKLLSSKYSDTSTKLQDLSPVLDDGTLLA
jgi:hypothetical protein